MTVERRRRRLRHRQRTRRDGQQRRPDGRPDAARPASMRARPTPTASRVTDPGADTRHAATDCGTAATAPAADTLPAAGSFDCSFPDGPASPTVSVDGERLRRRPDSDNATARDRRQRRSRPSILTGDGHGRRGLDPHLQLHGQRSGPGHAHDHDRLRRQRRQGRRRHFNAGTGAGSFECFFADGPATTDVTATVTDSDGAPRHRQPDRR